MKPTVNVLFVCMGNICRSPAGECLFAHLVEESGHSEKIKIDSAGTINFHAGNAPDKRMQLAGKARGYTIQGAARQIQTSDFNAFDLIITMDQSNHQNVLNLRPEGDTRAEIKAFCEFCSKHPNITEVPDPYYGGAEGFETVLDLLEDGCAGILDYITQKYTSIVTHSDD